METLQIKKEAAIAAHENAKSSGKKMLEDLFGKKTFQKDVMERIQDFDDILRENGLTKKEFDNSCQSLAHHEIGHRREILIVAAYNEGKLPDWSDGTPKYYPCFHMDDSPSGDGFSYYDCDDWNALSCVGARQVFVGSNAEAHMRDAVKKFLPQYKQSRTS